jgi:two-component sensor histidine kinase
VAIISNESASEHNMYASLAAESASDAIWLMTEQGEVRFANAAAVSLHRSFYGTELQCGALPSDLYGRAQLERWRSRIDAVAAGKQLFTLEEATVDGVLEHAEIVMDPVTGPDNGHDVLVAARRITGRRLEQHANHLQTLHSAAAELNAFVTTPETLYRRALELLKRTVEFDTASVQLLDDDELAIVACLGFDDLGMIESLRFPPDATFPNWHVVTAREAISVDDVGDKYPHFLEQARTFDSARIRSWLGVPLLVGDEVLGMVALDRNARAPFTAEEQRLVETMAAHVAVAVHNARLYQAQQESQARLRDANRQKELLLRELHHRVKNNMQLVSSLLSLRGGSVSAKDAKVFDEVRMRVQSLSVIHEELYRSDRLDAVDLADYTDRVVDMICTSYGTPGIHATVHADPVGAGMDISVPFGLVLGELVLNSIKHAFPRAREGEIAVSLSVDGGAVTLVVEDDGVGFPLETTPGEHGLGTQLVTSLAEQIGGELRREESAGTRWVMTFPVTGRARVKQPG